MNSIWLKLFVLVILFSFLLLIILLSNSQNDKMGNVKVYFLNLDNADCFIIKRNNYVVMIDTGEAKDLDKVKSKLEDLKIKTINHLILTHPDKDHIGNAKYIIANYKVEDIIETSYDKGSDIQKSFDQEVLEQGIIANVLSDNYNFNESGISFHLYVSKKSTSSNDSSIVTIMKYGKTRIFFGGDIEEKRIKELLNYSLPTCQIVKIPHHGEYDKLSLKLLNELNPKYIISTADVSNKITKGYKANYYNTADAEIVVNINSSFYKITEVLK